MPLIRQDQLLGYQVEVRQRREPIIDGAHEVYQQNGDPKLRDVWDLVFVDPQTAHAIVVSFDRDARDNLVQALTGGIMVADTVPQ